MKLFLAAMLVGACGAMPAAAQTRGSPVTASAVPRDAGAVVGAFHAALTRGDTKAALSMLADDVLVYESGRAERSKAEYAAQHLAADAVFAKAVRRAVTRRSGRAEGRFAWITSETTSKGVYKSRAIDSTGTETMLLRRDGRAWRIVHIHWSSADVK